jgi:hypothetical protein
LIGGIGFLSFPVEQVSCAITKKSPVAGSDVAGWHLSPPRLFANERSAVLSIATPERSFRSQTDTCSYTASCASMPDGGSEA